MALTLATYSIRQMRVGRFVADDPFRMNFFRFGSRRRQDRLDLERKLTRQVEAGRKLVIYDQETGLLASWYLALRCEEECYRSRRYGRSLSLLVVRAVGESEPR